MTRLLVVSIALSLGACVTGGTADNAAGVHVGTAEAALIAQLGPPGSIREDGATRYLSYAKTRPPIYIPPSLAAYQPLCTAGMCAPTSPAPGFMFAQQCTTTFAVEDGKVTSWQREGSDCR